jgi:hypothetical protein
MHLPRTTRRSHALPRKAKMGRDFYSANDGRVRPLVPHRSSSKPVNVLQVELWPCWYILGADGEIEIEVYNVFLVDLPRHTGTEVNCCTSAFGTLTPLVRSSVYCCCQNPSIPGRIPLAISYELAKLIHTAWPAWPLRNVKPEITGGSAPRLVEKL